MSLLQTTLLLISSYNIFITVSLQYKVYVESSPIGGSTTLNGAGNDHIVAKNAYVRLVMQGDGNLNLHQRPDNTTADTGWISIWSSNTDGNTNGYLIFDTAGDLTVYNAVGNFRWTSNSATGTPPFRLTVSDIGVAYVLDALNNVIWTTDSSPPAPYPTFALSTDSPTPIPTNIPTILPTFNPSIIPTGTPTYNPSNQPTYIPSEPSKTPTSIPSESPTYVPSKNPTYIPSKTSTTNPSLLSTDNPTTLPPSQLENVVSTLVTLRDGEYIDTTDQYNINLNDTESGNIQLSESDGVIDIIPLIITSIGIICVIFCICFIIVLIKRKQNEYTMNDRHMNPIPAISPVGSTNTPINNTFCSNNDEEIIENVQMTNMSNEGRDHDIHITKGENEFISDDDDDNIDGINYITQTDIGYNINNDEFVIEDDIEYHQTRQ